MYVLGSRVLERRQRSWTATGLVFLLGLMIVPTILWGQSLANVAEKEKDRRKVLKTQGPVAGEQETAPTVVKESEADGEPTETDASIEQGKSPLPSSVGSGEPVAQESGASNDTNTNRQRSPAPTTTANANANFQSGIQNTQDRQTRSNYDLRGALYIDWFRVRYGDDNSTSQLSTRFKLQWGRRPGNGWRVRIDMRDRWNPVDSDSNQLMVYDAALVLDDRRKPWTLAVGQMNLYDSAGTGQLLGGLFGYRALEDWTIGGYGGLEPRIYTNSLDASYQKYGVFARYDGGNAQSATVSYNTLRFAGNTERQFLYLTGLAPLYRLVVYGNMEYELGPNVIQADRLSRVFVNARYDVTDTIDITGNYSSGKGLDYHRFILEKSKDPRLSDAELERFYYSSQFGVRLGARVHPSVRVFVEQRISEQKDRGIRNNTTRLGASTYNVAGSRFSFYGSYSINRGDTSESNVFRFSASRDFGLLSWTAYYSTSFNGIRFDTVSGQPEVIHMDNRKTLSNNLFFAITEALAASFEIEFSSFGDSSENSVFARAIYRF